MEREVWMTGVVAQHLKLTSTGVIELIKRGELKIIGRTNTGLRLFDRAEVERVAEERRKNPPKVGRPRKTALNANSGGIQG